MTDNTYYTTFPSERQEFFFLTREFQRKGHQQETAVALADCEMSEIRYCRNCGEMMVLNGQIAAYECPTCGNEVRI